ncbi:hypothetical protein Kpol_1072p51 [Vanderwaltozyma polyspora DSM 70294]|uniref:37S ribosomal protein MRP51, mitochondrial n=1 Tax=Vanderwaltozyma polyspora (strain ATCC 22028 / DSM 70294 / BCRC 21397 / CBS 2163 / NBRC 10782 / NRRL Y-8283 / UCD 57-17) TaxID=436907 RepID=A7TKR9_VANPO|nr:uncharacterized protein Kpol_1072p51 [Vanderwaltozyma polyspora DSM 70294]EDO17181.1 hypothetical protein Kpol_1072p51 [Vanderwaltozyma polyspora DSM 70294]
MSVSQLLRKSKIAQVVNTKNPLYVSNKFHPTHQLITTKRTNFNQINDWGLKSPIPSRDNSRYLVYNDLDTLERIATYEKNNGQQWTRIRFNELNLTPTFNPGVANPLFKSNSVQTDNSSPLSSVLNLNSNASSNSNRLKIGNIKNLRSDFKKWLLDNDIDSLKHNTFNVKYMNRSAINYLNDKRLNNHHDTNRKLNLPTNNMTHVIGTGGLSYNLRGKLQNTPNGIKQKTIVPGRYLNVDGSKWLTGIGGMVGFENSSFSPTRLDRMNAETAREKAYPFEVQRISVDHKGNIMMRSRVVNDNLNSKFTYAREDFQRRPKSSRRAVTKEESSLKANELLGIVQSF